MNEISKAGALTSGWKLKWFYKRKIAKEQLQQVQLYGWNETLCFTVPYFELKKLKKKQVAILLTSSLLWSGKNYNRHDLNMGSVLGIKKYFEMVSNF